MCSNNRAVTARLGCADVGGDVQGRLDNCQRKILDSRDSAVINIAFLDGSLSQTPILCRIFFKYPKLKEAKESKKGAFYLLTAGITK